VLGKACSAGGDTPEQPEFNRNAILFPSRFYWWIPLHCFFNVRALPFKGREILCKAYCCDCPHLKMRKLALLGRWMGLTSLRKHAHCFVGIHDQRDCVRARKSFAERRIHHSPTSQHFRAKGESHKIWVGSHATARHLLFSDRDDTRAFA